MIMSAPQETAFFVAAFQLGNTVDNIRQFRQRLIIVAGFIQQ